MLQVLWRLGPDTTRLTCRTPGSRSKLRSHDTSGPRNLAVEQKATTALGAPDQITRDRYERGLRAAD
jgi:hypothetical protein